MIAALDHVRLAAPPGSEEQSRGFPSGVLGMAEVLKPPALAARGGCWFAVGSWVRIGVEKAFRPARKARPGLRVAGIEAYADRLESHGVVIVWDGDLPGHRRFPTEDPFGDRLQFPEPDAG